MTDNKLTDNEIKSNLEWLKTVGDRIHSVTIGKEFIPTVIDYIDRLEAEKKELQELVDDMGDYFPACIDCEGKTPLGERTNKCVYKLNNTNYCTKRGIATIFSIRNENRELKAENERLTKCRKEEVEKLMSATDRVILETKAEAYKEFAERLKEQAEVYMDSAEDVFILAVGIPEIDNLLKEMVGE